VLKKYDFYFRVEHRPTNWKNVTVIYSSLIAAMQQDITLSYVK